MAENVLGYCGLDDFVEFFQGESASGAWQDSL
jgi:hypothetical protein